jgi:hypothetical protein
VLGAALNAVVSVVAFALLMSLANPRAAATHFQIFMALHNAGSSAAAQLGGRLVPVMPAPALFGIGGLLELLPLPLLLLFKPRPREERP